MRLGCKLKKMFHKMLKKAIVNQERKKQKNQIKILVLNKCEV